MPNGDFTTVEARGLVKLYGATRALAGVDAHFRAGEVTAIEGANGSGKSTLVSVLARLTRPTQGEIRYDGQPRAPDATLRRRIGLLAHPTMLYPDLTGRDNLWLFARLYGLAHPRDCIEGAIHRFEIGRFIDRPTRTWSRGQLQRVALARALLHGPRLVLLDEPSTGLDPQAVERLVAAVDHERTRGTVIVLVTHDRALAARLGDRRMQLDRGRVVQEEPSA